MNKDLNLVNNEENTILQQKNYPSAISESEKMCSLDGYKTCGDCVCTTEGRYVGAFHFRESNEESSEETTSCKASVYTEFDDCTRTVNFVEILRFRHFRRVSNFKRDGEISRKKSISDGINVSVVMDIVCGNTSK